MINFTMGVRLRMLQRAIIWKPCVLRGWCYGSNTARNNSRTLRRCNPSCHAISCVSPQLSFRSCNYDIFFGCCTYSHWQNCIVGGIIVALLRSRGRCCSCRNTNSPWKTSARIMQMEFPVLKSVPARLLQAQQFKRTSQYSSCVYSVIFRSRLIPVVHWVS